MKKIESLTPEQIAKFPEYREKWIAKGLSTYNPPREDAESAVKKAYTCAELKEPTTFIWVESPLHAGVCYSLLKSEEIKKILNQGDSIRASVWDSVRASVGASVEDSVGASVRDSVWGSVWTSVWASVGASVGASVEDSVGASVRASAWDSVGDSVWDSVRASVWDSVRASVGASVCGSHEAGWLSFYSFFQNECNLDCSKVSGLWDCVDNCGWFIPFKNIVIISPKPYQIKTIINERGDHILHADGEPAVAYCEDFKIYAHKGVRIPQKLGAIHSSKWDPKWFIKETNVEIKRVIAEAVGYERLFDSLNAKKIDSYREYELYRAESVDIEPMHILTMTCPSTNKKHFGRVPPEILKARDAATWRNHGIDPDSFILEH